MKIATFNINNINRRLPNLLQWLKTAKPDIACLQELKSPTRDSRPQPSNAPDTRPRGVGSGRGTASRFSRAARSR